VPVFSNAWEHVYICNSQIYALIISFIIICTQMKVMLYFVIRTTIIVAYNILDEQQNVVKSRDKNVTGYRFNSTHVCHVF
jgi:hypothetical protein